MVNVDPVISQLESDKTIRIVADTRTEQGTRQVYGGLYPAAVLYLSPAYAQNNPKTVQSLTNAFVRGLKWMASHSAEDIAKVMPTEHALGDMRTFSPARSEKSLPMYSRDGRFTAEGAGNRVEGAARVRPRHSRCRDRPFGNLHERFPRQGGHAIISRKMQATMTETPQIAV